MSTAEAGMGSVANVVIGAIGLVISLFFLIRESSVANGRSRP
jgi:hypothetical protein